MDTEKHIPSFSVEVLHDMNIIIVYVENEQAQCLLSTKNDCEEGIRHVSLTNLWVRNLPKLSPTGPSAPRSTCRLLS